MLQPEVGCRRRRVSGRMAVLSGSRGPRAWGATEVRARQRGAARPRDRVYLHRGNCPKWPLWRSWRRRGGRAPCSAASPRPSSAPGQPRASGSPACARRSLAPPPRRPTREPRAMSSGQRACGDARKDGQAGFGVGRPATAAGAWAVSAVCLLLSVGSAAACLLLGAQAAALQGRVAALEEEQELLRRAGQPSALAAWAEPHLERLLREKLEGLAKHRTVREAPTACVCPPALICPADFSSLDPPSAAWGSI
ncbi:uncharacterized protein LOC116860697 [Lontra canadensis]|uniref:uncharacterized protein LOC116860697 n=1 Tax=Lontra canadensis TaxID=76717 RepID=UPI0013F348A8|nr:uncharacterized protein LOC116860697 [Lontra canadensis]